MKTTVKLHMSREALFQIMKDSLLQEIKTATNKAVDPARIKKGFTYTKKSKNRKVKITIETWKEPEEYRATFTSHNDAIQVGYSLRSQEQGWVSVTYEHIVLKNGKRTLLASRMAEKKALKQAKRMLRAVEAQSSKASSE